MKGEMCMNEYLCCFTYSIKSVLEYFFYFIINNTINQEKCFEGKNDKKLMK